MSLNSVDNKFDSYPQDAKHYLSIIRQWLYEEAALLQAGEVEVSLKWGEPSYRVKGGSPVRMDWKPCLEDKVVLYFVCTTPLIETFRQIYADSLEFEGNRAILLPLGQPLPEAPIRQCLRIALSYQSRRHLTLLGA